MQMMKIGVTAPGNQWNLTISNPTNTFGREWLAAYIRQLHYLRICFDAFASQFILFDAVRNCHTAQWLNQHTYSQPATQKRKETHRIHFSNLHRAFLRHIKSFLPIRMRAFLHIWDIKVYLHAYMHYMLICAHICTYAGICADMPTYPLIFAYICVYVRIYAYIRTYMRICAHICTDAGICADMPTHSCLLISAYMRAYLRICAHPDPHHDINRTIDLRNLSGGGLLFGPRFLK